MGTEKEKEKKKMRKKFGTLSKEEQEKREAEYHRRKPEEFNRLMTRARRYTPHTIRLPAAWIDGLEAMAELEGEPGFHTMVRRWIEERLRQESRLALRLSKMPLPKIAALLSDKLQRRPELRTTWANARVSNRSECRLSGKCQGRSADK
jgi:inosine/xanthosine triphosphate pyrophosphatase family protein